MSNIYKNTCIDKDSKIALCGSAILPTAVIKIKHPNIILVLSERNSAVSTYTTTLKYLSFKYLTTHTEPA